MPAPYGTFTRDVIENNQPISKDLNYFVLQFITDAIAQSALTRLQNNARAYLWDMHPNFQQLEAQIDGFNTLVSIIHDEATQELLPNNWQDKREEVPFWQWAMDVHTTIPYSPVNNDVIQDVHDEMIKLLTSNAGTYDNSISQGACTQIYNMIPRLNKLTEKQVLKEGNNVDRPTFLTSRLTIIFKINLGAA